MILQGEKRDKSYCEASTSSDVLSDVDTVDEKSEVVVEMDDDDDDDDGGVLVIEVWVFLDEAVQAVVM